VPRGYGSLLAGWSKSNSSLFESEVDGANPSPAANFDLRFRMCDLRGGSIASGARKSSFVNRKSRTLSGEIGSRPAYTRKSRGQNLPERPIRTRSAERGVRNTQAERGCRSIPVPRCFQWLAPEEKNPNPKTQIPNKLQVPKFQSQAMPRREGSAWATPCPVPQSRDRASPVRAGEFWTLEIVWDLGFGFWDFSHGVQPLKAARNLHSALRVPHFYSASLHNQQCAGL
jgi:hypothetical protein